MKVSYYKTEESVGTVICHDITKIERGAFKGALFKKGHRIREEDVEVLLGLGKHQISAIELDADELHEDEAGERIATALRGTGLTIHGPSEGRLDLNASYSGLLKIDVRQLRKINSAPQVVVSTLHTNSPVEAGQKVAGAKVIPLVVKSSVVERVEAVCAGGAPVISVLPYNKMKMGVVITGREVAEGRTKDAFAPVLKDKAANYGLELGGLHYAVDNKDVIAGYIKELLVSGCNLIVVTGGMSVDPDDVTPAAIRKAGAKIVSYGAPVLPGAMFLLAYKGRVPVVGLPACAMYYQTTVLDLFLPRLMVGETIKKADIAALGHGGLCRRCQPCSFPNCSFGKGTF